MHSAHKKPYAEVLRRIMIGKERKNEVNKKNGCEICSVYFVFYCIDPDGCGVFFFEFRTAIYIKRELFVCPI